MTLLARLTGKGTDTERSRRRDEIKAEIASLKTIESRRRELLAQCAKLDQREAIALEKHQKACEPLQAQLEAIEEKVTGYLLADQEIPDGLSKKRATVLSQLADENAKLETEATSLKALRKSLLQQISSLPETQSAISRLRGELGGRALAHPALVREKFVTAQDLQWADKRLREAEREVNQLRDSLASQEARRQQSGEDPGPVEEQLMRDLGDWEAELERAQWLRDSAVKRKGEIQEQLLD